MAFLPRARLESASPREALVHSDLETWEGGGESLNPVNQDPEAEVRQPAEAERVSYCKATASQPALSYNQAQHYPGRKDRACKAAEPRLSGYSCPRAVPEKLTGQVTEIAGPGCTGLSSRLLRRRRQEDAKFKAGLQNLVRAQWYSSSLSTEGNNKTRSLLRLFLLGFLRTRVLLCVSPALTAAPRAPSVSQALSQLVTLPRP